MPTYGRLKKRPPSSMWHCLADPIYFILLHQESEGGLFEFAFEFHFLLSSQFTIVYFHLFSFELLLEKRVVFIYNYNQAIISPCNCIIR